MNSAMCVYTTYGAKKLFGTKFYVENDYNIEIGSSKNEQESEQNVNVNEINNTNKKIENEKQGRINITKEQERIINEVLGEYLQ